jgi:transcriptional regulator with XRE-family HTH domain
MINLAMIKAKRLAIGLSMEQAAHRAGFPGRQRWNQIENGRRQDPQISTMCAVARALECTIDELVLPPKNKFSARRGPGAAGRVPLRKSV